MLKRLTQSRLKTCFAGIVTTTIGLLAGCADEAMEAGRVAETAPVDIRTPLEKLAPGQRLPNRIGAYSQAAYITVDVEENDAVSGRITITVDGANARDCERVSESLPPDGG